jgi:DEAD/DEAH box helicase domain-containing protein
VDARVLDSVVARFESSIGWVRDEPVRPARFADWPGAVHRAVVDAAAGLGIDRPWRHQASAMRGLLAGEHTVLASGTATGKSLGYTAPALSALLDNPEARVLYLAPTKALAQDQRVALERWNDALGGDHRVQVDAYDGDTPRAHRAAIRKRVRWLLTNPEMLHQGILPNHPGWAPLLANLRLVVVDELHVYRGVFGSHVANVLRRLARLVRFHGGGPLQLAACSATIANPDSLARQMIGAAPDCRVTVVVGADAPRSPRRFVCLVPPVVNPALGIRRRLSEEVERVTRALLDAEVRTIVFLRTRQGVEELVRALRRSMAQTEGLQSGRVPDQAIRAYRAGLRPAERRAIEQGLRDSTVRVVVSTSALELGVDIGSLQAVVLAGVPGDLASLRQQVGRAGRRGAPSLAVLVAGSGGVDRYLVSRPGLLLSGRPEHAQVDPSNPLILREHLRCAAFELPFDPEESLAGGDCGELLADLVREGDLRQADGRIFWVGGDAPAPGIGLRSMESDPITLHRVAAPKSSARRRNAALTSLDRSEALKVAHPGALYVHDGEVYRVESVDWEEGRALVTAVQTHHVTVARQEHELRVIEVNRQRDVMGGTVWHGIADLAVRTVGYRELDPRSGDVVAREPLDLPEVRRAAAAYWLTLSDDTVTRLRDQGWWRPDPVGYRGPDWQAQRRRARERDGCHCVHCGAMEQDRQHDIHHLRPFRDFGYVRGENQAYREANHLANLVTLCRVCHARAENGQRFHGAFDRLAHVLGNVAPLVLMCDPRDLELRVWSESLADDEISDGAAVQDTLSLVIAERTPAGVGFAEALFDLHEELLAHAQRLVDQCDCAVGCPACVGPPGENQGDGRDYARAILVELSAKRNVMSPGAVSP